MKKIMIVFILMILFCAKEAFAARRITLVDGSGVEVGTITNPLYTQ